MGNDDGRELVAFAERILALLDQGSFTATYKFAVLLAIMDLCLERTGRAGAAPSVLTTREIAEKVLELYWPQATVFAAGTDARVLRQFRSGKSQARIVTLIKQFRAQPAIAGVGSLLQARRQASDAFEQLVLDIEWKLIEDPLPRLQRVGNRKSEFLYTISWDELNVPSRSIVRQYQRGEGGDFDNRVRLRRTAGEFLVRLNGLLRPLIQREWTAMVASINEFEEGRLHEFLFGVGRLPLAAIRPALGELQDGRCFYCGDRFRSSERMYPEVDHFIPWSRYPDNGLDNLVAAHARCNGQKRDFLAADEHLDRWAARSASLGTDLERIAEELGWAREGARTLGVVRGIYLRLPEDALLWRRGHEFVPARDPARRSEILGATAWN